MEFNATNDVASVIGRCITMSMVINILGKSSSVVT